MGTRLNFSKATNASDLQKFLESNVVHRQGFTYGAPLQKKFCLFIDDLQATVCAQSEHFRNAREVTARLSSIILDSFVRVLSNLSKIRSFFEC
jgi:hypothetical protein